RPIDLGFAAAPDLALALGSFVIVLALADQDRPFGAGHDMTLQGAIGSRGIRIEVLGGFKVVERAIAQVAAAQADALAARRNDHVHVDGVALASAGRNPRR